MTLEENVLCGGFGEKVLGFATENNLPVKVLPIGIPDAYVEHGNVDLLKEEIGIDSDSIWKKVVTCYVSSLTGTAGDNANE